MGIDNHHRAFSPPNNAFHRAPHLAHHSNHPFLECTAAVRTHYDQIGIILVRPAQDGLPGITGRQTDLRRGGRIDGRPVRSPQSMTDLVLVIMVALQVLVRCVVFYPASIAGGSGFKDMEDEKQTVVGGGQVCSRFHHRIPFGNVVGCGQNCLEHGHLLPQNQG